ncbi:MAG: PKD domain-containing protein, partial [Nitrospirota bacterium]
DAEKYRITFKIKINDSQTQLQFIAKLHPIENAIKNTSQRDFLQEIQNKLDTGKKSKSMTSKELQLMEKQKKLNESLKKSDKKLQKIVEEKQKTQGEKTAKNIIDKYNQSKNSGNGSSPIIKNKDEKSKEPVIETAVSGSKVNVLISQYDRVTKGTSYVFQVKTFDVKKYSGTDWSKFDGKLDGVNISAQIIAPDGQVKEKFSGLTKYGMFEGSILVKDRLWPQGKYTLIVNSEFQGDKNSKSLKFFVIEEGSTGTNHPPVSNAGSDQNVVHPVLVTLVGSGSSDPDGDTMTYSWVQTSGTSVTLSSSTVSNPTFNTNGAGTLAFQLTVSDGRLTSTDTVTITVS